MSKQTTTLVTLVVAAMVASLIVASTEAKLLRRSRFFDDSFDSPYGRGPVATGERAIITVRGTRNPYDGSAPSKIAIEDNPYRGPYPRGVYDRADGYSGRQRMPVYPQDYGYAGSYGGYGSGYNGGRRRAGFFEPHFGVWASVNLVGDKRRRNRCRLNSEADSEILELGLDSARLSIDCDINPARVMDAAARVAQKYARNKKGNNKLTSSATKTRIARIDIDRNYERAKQGLVGGDGNHGRQ